MNAWKPTELVVLRQQGEFVAAEAASARLGAGGPVPSWRVSPQLRIEVLGVGPQGRQDWRAISYRERAQPQGAGIASQDAGALTIPVRSSRIGRLPRENLVPSRRAPQ